MSILRARLALGLWLSAFDSRAGDVKGVMSSISKPVVSSAVLRSSVLPPESLLSRGVLFSKGVSRKRHIQPRAVRPPAVTLPVVLVSLLWTLSTGKGLRALSGFGLDETALGVVEGCAPTASDVNPGRTQRCNSCRLCDQR